MMGNSSELNAKDFAESTVFDARVNHSDVVNSAITFAHSRAQAFGQSNKHAAVLVRYRPYVDADPHATLLAAMEPYKKMGSATCVRTALLAAVSAGIELGDFDEGLA